MLPFELEVVFDLPETRPVGSAPTRRALQGERSQHAAVRTLHGLSGCLFWQTLDADDFVAAGSLYFSGLSHSLEFTVVDVRVSLLL